MKHWTELEPGEAPRVVLPGADVVLYFDGGDDGKLAYSTREPVGMPELAETFRTIAQHLGAVADQIEAGIAAAKEEEAS